MGTIWQILSPPIRKVFSFLNKRSNKMDRHLFAVIIALLVSGMLFGCGGEPQQEESDERFSGPEFSEHVRTTDPRTPKRERRRVIRAPRSGPRTPAHRAAAPPAGRHRRGRTTRHAPE